MRTDIINYLEEEIYERAKKPDNKLGIGCYYHIEAADADAISHFDSIPSLLYLAYVNKKMSIEEGKNFVIDKLKRSYNKLSQESKEFYRDKYNNVMNLL